ncbi:hypothetical protein AM587_10011131 [Phytophthora nicotianae]|uniref:Uncharacterized protein n=1 Tax=Phytophthora nicotianae TaxID=4792 RepID=A0A0W8CC54_PHYNI|nr:hypothetical protein AM587_10011131 [Phytophthora nicotianae]
MTEWIDPKAFQRLWRSLTKAGWKAGAPSGLDSEHTYVKPGVKGRLPTGKAGVEYFKDIEQDGDVSGTATVPTQQGRGMIANNTTSLDVFDSPHFIDAMRTERLFGPLDADDVNIAEHYLEPREDVESVRDPVDTPVDLSDSYETEVESDDDFEDDSNEFGQDDTAMRAMAASGREIYDQNHCGDLQIDGADDLYKGTWGAHQVCCSLR